MRRALPFLAAGLVVLSSPASADPAPFDLVGPDLRISVTRQGVTLPIGAVPQLAEGDKVKVEAVLPHDESAHYLLIAAFLREPTNPPPDKWFDKVEAWKRPGHGGGPIELTVPDHAQHLVVFLAPETGGDFKTLRDAVKARPGAFVRAAQDLEQASLDRSRYETYLTAIRQISASQPEALTHMAPVVADSLHIKINDACLQRPAEFQAACLLDSKQSVVLGGDDTANTSRLTGAATDLALSLSATPQGGFGYFSPYISAIHEIVGIFGAMRTARYQYVPALGALRGDTMALALNTPPSFANPKSVLMAALPAVRPTSVPVLRIAPKAAPACLGASSGVLSLSGSPLLYATAYGHDLSLRVSMADGKTTDLALTPNALRGGLDIAAPPPELGRLTGPIPAKLHGMWGFEPLDGPEVTLQTAGDWHWQQGPSGAADGHLVLTGATSGCVSEVSTATPGGKPKPVEWKASGEHEISVALPPQGQQPLTLTIAGPEGTPPASITLAPPAKAPQPVATIIARGSDRPHADPANALEITLGSPDAIPADTRLSFTLKAQGKERFDRHDSVEVATAKDDASVKLSLGSGLTLVDPSVMIASLTPAQALGGSAFGPLHARLVRGGVAGDWLPVGTLVRLPRIRQVTCSAAAPAPCTLQGEGLYLLASVSARQDFDGAANVPEGFPGGSLSVPHPGVDGVLYLRLHDAPEIVNRVTVKLP